mgnify:CR=1
MKAHSAAVVSVGLLTGSFAMTLLAAISGAYREPFAIAALASFAFAWLFAVIFFLSEDWP